MARRIWEFIKNIVIVVLVLNILLLTLMALPASITRNFSLPPRLAEILGLPQKSDAPQVEEQQRSTETKPVFISVRQTEGRATIRRDATALALAYDRFGGFLATALTTAENPTVISGWDFLHAPGLMFSYPGKVPAQALSQWLSQSDGAVTDIAAQYLLCQEGSQVHLYTVTPTQVTRYATDISAAELLNQLGQYLPDGSDLASEVEGHRLFPLTLWEEQVVLPAYSAANPMTQELSNELAAVLDFNPYGVGTYTDPNGNTVYTETDRTLVVSPSGGVTLSTSESSARLASVGEAPSDYIRAAETLLKEFYAAANTEDATFYLCDYRLEGDLVHCSFCQVAGGVPVYPACAEATFRGQEMISFSCTLRIFHKTGGIFSLMPLTQAAAIAEDGALLVPAYQMTASGITAGWYAQ